MHFDYQQFHIDASPLDEGGHYYARAKIYRRASVGGDAVEVKYSGDLGDYPMQRPQSKPGSQKGGRSIDGTHPDLSVDGLQFRASPFRAR